MFKFSLDFLNLQQQKQYILERKKKVYTKNGCLQNES